ncbi:MAG: hypothetical protein ACFFAH_08700 [Promethearchaeota archaeon]
MRNNFEIRVLLKTFLLISLLLVQNIYINYPTRNPIFNLYPNAKLENNTEQTVFKPIQPIKNPKSTILGDDPWWDNSFQYRRLINITNPYNMNFTNYGVNISFYYEDLVQSDKLQSDLDDIRIVENGILRKYYVAKDYPSQNYTTVWFDTNITQKTSEIDTYMYFGNPDAGNTMASDPSDCFGWVKNGDFELDGDDSALKFVPFGWQFTDDPVNYVADLNNNINVPLDPATSNEPFNNSVASYNAFVFKLTGTPQVGSQEGLAHGNYAYKWGPNTNNVEGGTYSSHEYVGTLYSYPFKVPKVEGGGIKLNFWRNARTYIFEANTEGGAQIDYDGYFIRLCNGTAAKYTSDVDDHENAYNTDFNNYLEAYGGKSDFVGNRWKWVNQLRGHYADSQNEQDTGPAANLTDDVYIDISQYEGKEIFLEFGSWGQENGDDLQNAKRSGFFQLDYVRFNYTLTGILDELQSVDNEVTVVAVDVDGRSVPNVNIFIVNQSARGQQNFIVNESFAPTGVKTFTKVPIGNFNITANYTLANGTVVEVFNSSLSGDGPYYFNGINYTVQIKLDLWTIDFEIVDWDGIPLKYGYIELRKSKNGKWLQNITLDENGNATFRWWNASSYYYKVYYDNDDYSMNPISLNESYVIKEETSHVYVKTLLARINIKTVYYNEITKQYDEISAFIKVVDNTTGKSLINLTSNADAYPPLKDGYAYSQINELPFWFLIGRTYNFTIDTGNLTNVNFNITYIDPIQWIPSQNEEINEYNYTLYSNSSITFNIIPPKDHNFTNFNTKLNITFAVDTVFWGDTIHIWATFLSTDDNWKTWSYVSEPPGTCRIIIKLLGTETILFNEKMQYIGNGNYSLFFDSSRISAGSNAKNYIFEIRAYHLTYDDPTPLPEYVEVKAIPTWRTIHDYEDNYNLEIDETFEIFYQEFLNISVRYYILASNDLLDGATVTYRWKGFGPSSIPITLDPANQDYFTFLIDSGIALGVGLRQIEVTAVLENYASQIFDINIDINPRPTLLNGENNPFSKEWKVWANDDEMYNFSYTDAITGENLDDAYVYSWEWYIGDDLQEDGYLIRNTDGTYTLDFDTETRDVGFYIIEVALEQANYEDQNVEIELEIKIRPTSINGKTYILNITKEIFISTHYNFTFEYNDTLINERIKGADQSYYYWYNLSSNGEEIGDPSANFDLNKTLDDLYILDFDTENRPIAKYRIYVIFNKTNYEPRFVIINLIISQYIIVPDLDKDKEDKDDDKDDSSDFLVLIIIITTISTISAASIIAAYLIKKRLKISRKE